MAELDVLVVDDEKNIRTTLGVCLEGLGCRVTAAPSAGAAREWIARQPFDLAFVDLRLAEQSGLDLIPDLLAASPDLDIVVITAYATVDTAVLAIKRGAREYLPKPFTPAQIRHVVGQVADRRSLLRRVKDLEGLLRESVLEADLETGSPRMKLAFDTVLRAAGSDVSVLLRGESGTGKGVLARLLHSRSARAAGPFVVISCPTLSQELLASELFGHAKGSFTGAIRDNPGRVETADRGTLFLDEIAEIPPSLQAKLLRFLQEKEFERVGENRTRRADVRVVAATNRDLEAEVAAGRFREDLLYRLNVVEVQVPALRERPEDVLPLARRFAAFFAAAAKRPTPELSQAACERAHGPHLAGQRPRAAQRHRARGDAVAGGGRSSRTPSRSGSPRAARRLRVSAATSASTRSSASTSCACSRASRRSSRPPSRWASTSRPCGGSARSTACEPEPRAGTRGARHAPA